MTTKTAGTIKARGKDLGTLGGRIADARRSRGWTQADLARKMGVSRAAVSDWEKNKVSDLKMEHLVLLAELTEYSMGWIALKREPIYRRLIKGEDEHELVKLYRGMKKETQQELITAARRYHKSDNGDRPTPTVPYEPAETVK